MVQLLLAIIYLSFICLGLPDSLFGFSISHSFMHLCIWAVSYGLGAGSVDVALNNYVALHYRSRHMSVC